ncbi:hypothetical protein [Azospirillum doebereinerae]
MAGIETIPQGSIVDGLDRLFTENGIAVPGDGTTLILLLDGPQA